MHAIWAVMALTNVGGEALTLVDDLPPDYRERVEEEIKKLEAVVFEGMIKKINSFRSASGDLEGRIEFIFRPNAQTVKELHGLLEQEKEITIVIPK